jgi:hypothetical protein
MTDDKLQDILNDPGVSNAPCPYCGAPRNLWPDDDSGGYRDGDLVYCTLGCRDGPGCTSDHFGWGHPWEVGAPSEEEIRYDEASAEFLQAHRTENKTIEPNEYGDPNVAKRAGPTQGVD